MYKPSKIKHPSIRNTGKNRKKGEPAYASSGTAPTLPAAPESSRTYAAPEPQTQDGASTTDKPVEETRKPVVNEDEQKKVVNQPATNTASAYSDAEES